MDTGLIIKELKKHLNLQTDTDLANFLGVSQPTISSWRSRNSLDEKLIITKCNDINPNWLLTGKGDMLKTGTVTYKESENRGYKATEVQSAYAAITKRIPLIPIDAMAGFGGGEMQVMDYDAETYIVPEFTELNVDFMIRVKGSSMYPKYNSGDIVACKKLSLKDIFFQWNKVYVLDTEQGALVKRIKKASDNDHILIVSDNPSYDPFELHLSKVYAVALVVGVIRLE